MDTLGKMMYLHIKAAQLLLLLCADTAVCRHAERGRLGRRCKRLLLRRDDDNAVPRLITRDLLLHLPPLLPFAFRLDAGAPQTLDFLWVKRFCHRPIPVSVV